MRLKFTIKITQLKTSVKQHRATFINQKPRKITKRNRLITDIFKLAQLPQSNVDQADIGYLRQMITKIDLKDENINSIFQ